MIKYLIIGIVALGVGIWLFVRFWKKHQKIDTESIAVVKEVIDLGRDKGVRKLYAIKYEIQSSEPFSLLETPVSKKLPIDKMRTIFYEKENPKNNFFFKTIGQFDRRICAPCFLIFIGLIITISQMLSLIS